MSKVYENEAVSMQETHFLLPDAAHAASRVALLEWHTPANDLNESGNASLKQVLTSGECEAIASLYMSNDLFRSRVVMARQVSAAENTSTSATHYRTFSSSCALRCTKGWRRLPTSGITQPFWNRKGEGGRGTSSCDEAFRVASRIKLIFHLNHKDGL